MAQAQRIDVANDVTPDTAEPSGRTGAATKRRPSLRQPDLDPPNTLDTKRLRRRQRPVLLRLFGISLWGWIKLTVLCVLVGFVVMAINFDPRTVEVDVTSTVDTLVRNAITAGGWLVENFWRPALAGATVVIPLWVLWRLVSLPFRR